MGLESISSRYLDGRPVMNCAESTAAKVDEVVMGILKEAYAKALELIRANMDILDEAARFLIEKETITGKEFMKIFNEKKGISEETEAASAEAEEIKETDEVSEPEEVLPQKEQPEEPENNSQDV